MRNLGKISETVLDRSVIKPIKQNKLGIKGASTGLDCAFLGGNGIATGYVAYSDTNSCRHAIIQACNNLWAQFVKPQIITLSISMPDSYREIRLKEIMKQACATAEEMDVKIVGGHTEYVCGLATPIISVTAMGEQLRKVESFDSSDNLDIVMTKWMGISGTSILAKEKMDQLTTRLPSYYVKEAAGLDQFVSIAREAQIAIEQDGTKLMHDVAGGGIFAAIWEICGAFSGGCKVDLNNIPVLQETIEVAEFFDINPYRLRGDGSLLILSSNGSNLVQKLREAEINATIIGHTCNNLDRLIIRDDETRFLEPGNGDELLSVLNKQI